MKYLDKRVFIEYSNTKRNIIDELFRKIFYFLYINIFTDYKA